MPALPVKVAATAGERMPTPMAEPKVEESLKTWDEVKTTTCYMCA